MGMLLYMEELKRKELELKKQEESADEKDPAPLQEEKPTVPEKTVKERAKPVRKTAGRKRTTK